VNAEHSIYNRDRTKLLEDVLERYGSRYRPSYKGNQKVRCIDSRAHPNGDRNPSASVNLGKGVYHCFACGLSGDGYSLLKALEGWDAKQVNEFMDSPRQVEESEWL